MGQCMSRKAAGAFAASAAAAHNRPSKGKHAKLQSPDDDGRDSTTTTMRKNNHNTSSRGVAMSFGFKRRPTTAPSALATSNANAARRLANADVIDTNGNDHIEEDTRPLTANAQPSGRSTPKLPPPKKEGIASQRVSRFGFRQPQVNRMNKVADLNAGPIEFGAPKNSALQRPLPTNTVSLQDKYKPTRFAIGSTPPTPGVDNNRNRTTAVKTTVQTNQMGKYTLQSNQLPRPQSVRVLETKAAKTISNNNMKMASSAYRRPSPDESSKDGSLTEDSGLGSHMGTDVDNPYLSPTTGKYKHRNLEVMLNGNTFDVRDTDDSMEVPLPQLPCAFRDTSDTSVFQNTGVVRERTLEYERQIDKEVRRKISVTSSEGFSDASCQNDNSIRKPQFVTQKSFLKPKPSPVNTFLKSKVVDNKGYSSSASSDEHEWAFGGEAMADEVTFSISSSDESRDRDNEFENLIKKAESLPNNKNIKENNYFVKKTLTTLPLRTEFKNVMLTIADRDQEPVSVINNLNELLDEESSPIESLLSFSEAEEILKKKLNKDSSDSKDINEKSSPTSPGTPTNASNSLSLSEGKDDFLIDDEIADQPGLVFGDKSQHNSETTLVESTPRTKRKKLRNFEGSPLVLKDKKHLRGSSISLDTLSPCESIASDDLMMDYDYSQSSGLDECDKFEKRIERTGHPLDETITFSSVGSIETEIKNNEQLRDWSALLNYSSDKTAKCTSRSRFLRSRTTTPNSISDSPSSLDGRSNGRTRFPAAGSPLRRLAHASSLGYESDDSVVKLDRATHAAIKNDIVSVKTMLLKLRRVLNEQTNEDILLMSETRNPFDSQVNGNFHGFSSEVNSCSEGEEDSGRLELVDLRRQVLFLQGQLEDKEKAVQSLQEQMTKMCVDTYLSNSAPASTVNTERETCNAATQTERIRPLSVGPSLPNGQAESTPGSLVSANELPRKIRTSSRADTPTQKKTPIRERRKLGDTSTPQSAQRFPNSMISTSIPRRSESRSRAAPSSFT